MRISFDTIYMDLALNLAKRSTCARLQVGTVITSIDHRYVLGLGYNGSACGLNNGCDVVGSPCGCLHSECNAVINCNAARDAAKIVYVTYAPCTNCAKILINLGGVKKVIYNEDYRDRLGVDLLTKANIQVEKFK